MLLKNPEFSNYTAEDYSKELPKNESNTDSNSCLFLDLDISESHGDL